MQSHAVQQRASVGYEREEGTECMRERQSTSCTSIGHRPGEQQQSWVGQTAAGGTRSTAQYMLSCSDIKQTGGGTDLPASTCQGAPCMEDRRARSHAISSHMHIYPLLLLPWSVSSNRNERGVGRPQPAQSIFACPVLTPPFIFCEALIERRNTAISDDERRWLLPNAQWRGMPTPPFLLL